MKRYLLELQFYGRNYDGFQRQGNTHNTVQEVLETALGKLFSVSVQTQGCSRTDAGVSAESFFCHFDANTKLPAERICFKLNRFLPKDVQAVSSREVPASFDARRDVLRKTYVYTFYRSPHRLPLYERDAVRVSAGFDAERVRNAAACLTGRHDFSAFRTVGYEKGAEDRPAVRTLESIRVEEDGKRVRVYFTGDGFLYNMVRIMAGTLAEVGEGTRSSESVCKTLQSGDRSEAGRTMPPKGLCLLSVEYPPLP